MEKKTLNLNFVELGHQEGDSNVCLMPCPCSSSYSYPTTTYQGVGGKPCGIVIGYIAGKIADNLITHGIPESDPCIGDECSLESDWGGINAEIGSGSDGQGGDK
jgi:hypothetical protein